MKICIVEDCGRKHYAKGYCRPHYDRIRRLGTLENFKAGKSKKSSRPYKTPEESFAARTEWQGDCLIWTGSTKPNGYGQLRVGGKTLYAHRYAWEREYGEVPEGYELDHICHNPPCVNLPHLRLATRGQNMGHRKGGWGETGVKNVYITEYGTFKVRITKDKVRHNFGTYKNLADAARVAEAENLKLYGEFSI